MATIAEIEAKFADNSITLADIISCCQGFNNTTQQTLIQSYFAYKYAGGGAATIDTSALAKEAKQDAANLLLTAIDANTDGIEGLLAVTNALIGGNTTATIAEGDQTQAILEPIRVGVDALVAQGVTDATTQTNILNAVDGLEALVTASNVLLSTGNDQTDQLETLQTAANAKLEEIRAEAAAAEAERDADATALLSAVDGVETSLDNIDQRIQDLQAALELQKDYEDRDVIITDADGTSNRRKGVERVSYNQTTGVRIASLFEYDGVTAAPTAVPDNSVSVSAEPYTVDTHSGTLESLAAPAGNNTITIQGIIDAAIGVGTVVEGWQLILIQGDTAARNKPGWVTPLSFGQVGTIKRLVSTEAKLSPEEILSTDLQLIIGETANAGDTVLEYNIKYRL